VRLTSKRQATFPVRVCQALDVRPGDELALEQGRDADGSTVWRLKPVAPRARPWMGRLRRYAAGKSHAMETVRASIARARQLSE
jgi:bifunctional DNA-binding transcriptional regulator/antitoxin component of YhaV-PrlF toxin-antitoxin module